MLQTAHCALDNENHRPGPKSRRTRRKKSRYKPMPKSELSKRLAQNSSPQFQINFSNKCSESFDGFETNDNNHLGQGNLFRGFVNWSGAAWSVCLGLLDGPTYLGKVSLQVDSLWGDCTFIPADWGP